MSRGITKRILHVIPDLVPYGAERVVGTLAAHGSRNGHQLAVASLYEEYPGSLSPELRREGVQIFHLNKRRGFDARMFHRLSAVFRKFQPHVIHTHNYVLRYVVPAAILHNPPAIVHTIHNVADREVDRVGVWLQRKTFGGRVHPVVIAEEGAASFARVYEGFGQPPLIRNGIKVARYAAASARREAWRTRNGFSTTDLLFVCVARYFAQKNHQTLIEAFAAGPAKIANTKLLLAGDGHLREQVETQVRAAGIEHQVHFLGRREDVPELLGASDVFALASLWEGNPLSVMEAMAAGLPCVVTAVGGVPELVADRKQGFVVPPGDAAALSAAMQCLANDSAMRQAMGIAAALRAETEFDDRHMVEAYESLYDELLSAKNPSTAGELAVGKESAA
jgi:glycosyltransferase involved in cell wall biosynthesis